MTPNRDVLIVGGGLAGLVAAATLARRGLRVQLWEGATHLGGRGRSEHDKGFVMNLGPHALFKQGALAGALRELGVRVEGGVPAASGMAVKCGFAHTLPAGPVSLLTSGALELGAKIDFGRAMVSLRRARAETWDGVPVARWLEVTLGASPARALVEGLVRVASYTHAPERLDAGMVIRQLQWATDQGVLYLDGGWQVMVDRLAEVARAAGAVVRCGTRAVELGRDAGRWSVRAADGTLSGVDEVVLAVTPEVARRLLAPLGVSVPELTPVRASCLTLGLRALPEPSRRFALGLDAPTYFSVHSAYADLAPEGHFLVHTARYLAPHESAASEAETQAILDAVQPGWQEHVVARRFYPNLTVTHALAEAAPGAGRPAVTLGDAAPGVYLAGDWVGPTGMLADASAASALAACRAIETRASASVAA